MDLVQHCQPLPAVEALCGDGESPQLEILCESQCAQELLGSFSECSVEPALRPIFQSHCSDVVDHDGDGDIDLDDQECTNRGDSIVNNTDVCPIVGQGTGPISLGGSQCPGTCTGEHGIGVGKKAYLAKQFDASTLEMMRTLKRALDPHAIMNPGKLVDL